LVAIALPPICREDAREAAQRQSTKRRMTFRAAVDLRTLTTKLPKRQTALAIGWPCLYRSAMPWNYAWFIGAVALLLLAATAAILSEKPAIQKGAHLLWAIALIFLTAALAYLITAQALNWF
jgi:hypothetical protein